MTNDNKKSSALFQSSVKELVVMRSLVQLRHKGDLNFHSWGKLLRDHSDKLELFRLARTESTQGC